MDVVETTNESLRKLAGMIVDETKETLVVDVQGQRKVIMKHAIVFRLQSGELIDGKTIMKRPEERMKGK